LATVALLLTVAVSGWLAAPAAGAAPGPRPAFQLPFPCGDRWWLDASGPAHAPALDMQRSPTVAGTEGSLVVAAADGVVNQSFLHQRSDGTGAGEVIQINHGGGWFTTYLHLQSRSVSVGQHVHQGQEIGRVGKTGTTSNKVPHLHFEAAIDTNGDGEASWGFEGSERVRPWFNGREFGQVNTEWKSVYSNNCGEMPAATSTSSRMDVFVRGTDRRIYQRTFTTAWSADWRSTGPGILSSAPAAVAWTDNNGLDRIDLFANGAEDANGLTQVYWQTSFDGGTTWQPWQLLVGGNLSTQPAAAVLHGSLYLMGRGTDGHLYSRVLTPTFQPRVGEWSYTWGGWQRRTTDVLNSAPSATSYGTDQVQVWYTRPDRRPYQVFWIDSSRTWAGPIQPGGAAGSITSALGVVQWTDNLELYGRGTDGRVYYKAYRPNSGWGDWFQQPDLGLANSGVGATVHGGNTNLFVRGSAGNVLWTQWVGGWQGYTNLGGQAL
jgi:hypothetical protein